MRDSGIWERRVEVEDDFTARVNRRATFRNDIKALDELTGAAIAEELGSGQLHPKVAAVSERTGPVYLVPRSLSDELEIYGTSEAFR
jgi:hypothetical protein